MAVEPAAKRRKLNNTTNNTSAETPSRSRENARTPRSTGVVPQTESSPIEEVQDDLSSATNGKLSAKQFHERLRKSKSSLALQQSEIPDTEDEGLGTECQEEVSVRSSSRVRRLPTKLQESGSAVTSRASTPVRTPRRRQTPAMVRPKQQQDSTRAEVAETPPLSKAQAKESGLRGGGRRLGKENVSPHGSTEISSTVEDVRKTVETLTPSRVKNTLPATEPVKMMASTRVTSAGHDLSAHLLQNAQQLLLARITGKHPIELVDRTSEFNQVSKLIKQTVESGESNNMLLIGARGTGKTALINSVLRAQRSTHAEDFHVVRLNGFIHTDDKLALRDIWRQLGREMELEEENTTVKSYADTLSMLLALLSHPSELGQDTESNHINKSVIFILDEFDLFATHPRQTLLYNLFDISQSRKAPIAVLGLTTRVDVVEALEKRVKSRFSHRYVHLAPAKNLATFTQICKSCLEMTADHSPQHDTWNAMVQLLFDDESFSLSIRKVYHQSKSVPDFLTMLLMPIGTLPTHGSLTSEELAQHFISNTQMALLAPDSKLDILSSLSTLQLALLICAARQNAIHGTESVSFNLAYEEYKSIAGKAKIQATASGALGASTRVWGKDVARNAWHDLINMALVMEDGRGVGRVDIALEEIATSGVELGQWGRWCKQI